MQLARTSRARHLTHRAISRRRHNCVILLLGLGAPPHIVMRIVGHATLDVTMGIYAYAALEEQRQILRKLEKLPTQMRLRHPLLQEMLMQGEKKTN